MSRVHRFGRDIDTDRIIPARWCYSMDPAHLRQGCFEHERPGFRQAVQPGDFLFADENFGCGSSREHAPVALMGCGIAAVVAASYARIFFRNAINVGLPVLTCLAAVAAAREGDEAEVDLSTGRIRLGGRAFQAEPLPPFIQNIVSLGGLMPYVRQKLEQMR